MFHNKKLLITGGTGSFGHAVLERFLQLDIQEIRIFSRDEKKQDDLRKRYTNPRLKCYLGDIRDYQSILNASRGVDYIFHAAALKQVPSCEFHPMEAVKTNILGTENVLEAAIQNEVHRVICLSTDKAVYPINAMGISKAMMEKVMVAKSRQLDDQKTVICSSRYGNVMGSRGSVIPLFANQIRNAQPLTITDPNMTRFMMTLQDAVDLVFYAFMHGKNGDIFVQKSPASTLYMLAKSMATLLTDDKDYPIHTIGTRHGEKLHETLLSREELANAVDLGNYFRIPADFRDLNYAKFVEEGEEKIAHFQDYNSQNTKQLTPDELQTLLLKLNLIKHFAQGNSLDAED